MRLASLVVAVLLALPIHYTLAQSAKQAAVKVPNIVGERWRGVANSSRASFGRCIDWKKQEGNRVTGTVRTGYGNACDIGSYSITGTITSMASGTWKIETNSTLERMKLHFSSKNRRVDGYAYYGRTSMLLTVLLTR